MAGIDSISSVYSRIICKLKLPEGSRPGILFFLIQKIKLVSLLQTMGIQDCNAGHLTRAALISP